ncbi:peptide-N(4)-(N-acetyl-beta-D-glucosaminyl) asparagine amidase F [Haematococcus lacustris]|uniref:Peptide-N(4)-(N-acetyl-beta-D-glucosaminyl) asparagine amidase F n=1 Tax=Haematococcus lacustris TaxID=44745 RepID=A0A699YNV2_HAELA|nr:peptide-N(4)-(N-acetyl-beta-D-glucosaminyl) asparagine amidase F [Haematococcus lacustris]
MAWQAQHQEYLAALEQLKAAEPPAIELEVFKQAGAGTGAWEASLSLRFSHWLPLLPAAPGSNLFARLGLGEGEGVVLQAWHGGVEEEAADQDLAFTVQQVLGPQLLGEQQQELQGQVDIEQQQEGAQEQEGLQQRLEEGQEGQQLWDEATQELGKAGQLAGRRMRAGQSEGSGGLASHQLLSWLQLKLTGPLRGLLAARSGRGSQHSLLATLVAGDWQRLVPLATVPLFQGGDVDADYNARPTLRVAVPPGAVKAVIMAVISSHGANSSDCAPGCCPTSHHFTVNGLQEHVASFEQEGQAWGCAQAVRWGAVPNGRGGWYHGRHGPCGGQQVPPWLADVSGLLLVGEAIQGTTIATTRATPKNQQDQEGQEREA